MWASSGKLWSKISTNIALTSVSPVSSGEGSLRTPQEDEAGDGDDGADDDDDDEKDGIDDNEK